MGERKKRIKKRALSSICYFRGSNRPQLKGSRHGVGNSARHRQNRREILDLLYAASTCIAGIQSASNTLPELFEILSPVVSIKAATLFQNREDGIDFFMWEVEPGLLQDYEQAKVRASRSYTYLSGMPTSFSTEVKDLAVVSPFAEALPYQTITLPLVVGREPVFGVLQLSCHDMDECKLSILNGIGNQLAMALDRGYQLKQQKEHFLREQAAVAAVKETEAQRICEARFRMLAESAPMLVWIADPEVSIQYVNPQWTQYTGLTLEQSLGDGWLKTIHPDDRTRVLEAWRAAVNAQQAYQAEHRILGADGTYRWHLSRAVLGKDDANGTLRWTGTSTDIDEQKRWEAELTAAKQKAEAANQAKSAFLANMSHEIRTPVGIIIGYTDLLLEMSDEDEEQSSWLKTMKRNSEVLLDLINELLDLSKIEAGQLAIEKINVNLTDFVKDASNLMVFKAQEKGLQFRVCCEHALPKTIRTDPTRLRQIFLNVVGNAIKFTERGEVVVVVRLARGIQTGQSLQVEFEVQDTGIGLSADQHERIWEPFVQVDASTTRKYGGTGLGLALSLRLARALGGDLQLAQSSPGKGSVFIFRIDSGVSWEELQDIQPEKSDAVLPMSSHCRIESKEIPIGMETKSLSGSRVLVVEDTPDNQVLIRKYLEVEGAKVDLASDGSEGIKSAETGGYDVVLMDIHMPGDVDGYAATERLRRLNFKKPIIALTAHTQKGDMEKARQSGFDEYLVKPIDRDLLIQTVSKHVRNPTLRWLPSQH